MTRYRAFFKRNPKSIYGLFTIMDTKTGEPVEGLKRVPVASGQAGWTNTSWTRGKSPCPYSNGVEGDYRIIVSSPPLQPNQDAGRTGIGEFWPIASEPAPGRLITHRKKSRDIRSALGIHFDNAFPGSAGCIVVIQSERAAWNRLSKFLWEVYRAAEEKAIELIVFN